MTITGTRPTLTRRSLVALVIGNALEWYDWAVYAYVAPQIASAFFPGGDPITALLATFGVFAIAFLFRPLGGLIFGSLGDRFGRKRVLVAIILLISISSALIGLLPTYHAVGIVAPMMLVLIRMVQGVSAGGEYGGASTYLAESTDPRHRGRYISLVPSTSYIGLLVASLLVIGLRAWLGTGAFDEWGWRILFLIALPAGIIGLLMRRDMDESASFTQLKEEGGVSRRPLRDAFVHDWRSILQTIGLMVLIGFGTYIIMTYLSVYLTTAVGYDQSVAQWVTTALLLAAIIGQPLLGRLSDRAGRRKVMLASAIALLILAVPAFMLLQSAKAGIVLVTITAVVLALVFVTYQATALTAMTELFSVSSRLSGFNIGYNVSIALFAGTAPYISTWLIQQTGNDLAPAFVLVVAAVVSILTVLKLRETAPAITARNRAAR